MANETLTFRPSKKNETILSQLAELAEQENRSLNNYIETLFINHLKERGQKIRKLPAEMLNRRTEPLLVITSDAILRWGLRCTTLAYRTKAN